MDAVHGHFTVARCQIAITMEDDNAPANRDFMVGSKNPVSAWHPPLGPTRSSSLA